MESEAVMGYVYQLKAVATQFACEPPVERYTSTVFETERAAAERIDKFREALIERAYDEPILISVISLEVIRDT